MADEKTADEKATPVEATETQAAPQAAKPQAEAGAAAKAAPKKEKPPALEDKPFEEFIQQNFLPTLATALKEKGLEDVQLTLDQRPLDVFGINDSERYWQVKGQWLRGARQFNIAFTKDSISSPKLFYYADKGSQASTIEQFMGDERKINLDLLVLFTLRRLNGQKWLARN